MPANIPIDDQRVQFELTRYLPDLWPVRQCNDHTDRCAAMTTPPRRAQPSILAKRKSPRAPTDDAPRRPIRDWAAPSGIASSRRAINLLASLVLASTVAGCGGPDAVDEQADGVTIWYVQGTPDGTSQIMGRGTEKAPFTSLAEAESASGPGEEIRVLAPLPGSPPLDGGIALKAGQSLRGTQSADDPPPITNTDPQRRGGDVVTLADDSTVTGVLIVGAAGHAVVGRNVTGAVVSGNQIRGGNLAELTSVRTGGTAALGVPAFPKAIVAFIDDGAGAAGARGNTVSRNEIEGVREPGGELKRLGGAGIALHARGSSDVSLAITGNRISDLGPGFPRSGILIDAQEDARVTLEIDDNRVTNAYQSSDGMLVVAQHKSSITAAVRRYEYLGFTPENVEATPELGVGNNGLEVVTYFGANWLKTGDGKLEMHQAQTRLLLEESDIEGAGGFGLVVWNIFGKPSTETVLDFGGGELGGRGANRILNNGTELPAPLDVYVVHQDLNAANNWWGDDSKIESTGDSWRLKGSSAFLCPGEPDQLKMLNGGTGTNVWSMFCQTLRSDICGEGAQSSDCCDPGTDPTRCMVSLADTSLDTAPALREDPRP